MAEKFLTVEIITPQRSRKFEEVLSCSAPGVLGRFQILPDHTPFVSQLDIGELVVEMPGGKKYFALSGGFSEVYENRILLLLETCEAAEEIDVERAKKARERALQRLTEKAPGIDLVRAEAALRRALNRLRVAEKVS